VLSGELRPRLCRVSPSVEITRFPHFGTHLDLFRIFRRISGRETSSSNGQPPAFFKVGYKGRTSSNGTSGSSGPRFGPDVPGGRDWVGIHATGQDYARTAKRRVTFGAACTGCPFRARGTTSHKHSSLS
jgi:hypothetical protein